MLAKIGLSMAMGAFVAGLLVVDSEFRHQVTAEIQPFRGLSLGLFFMSLALMPFFEQPLISIGLVLLLMPTKAALLWLLARLFGHRGRTAPAIALILAQSWEFALLLFAVAFDSMLLDVTPYQRFLLVVVLSMLATPPLAGMVLTDDNFASIVSAVRCGRELYDKILKFIRFQLSTSVGAILTVFFAPLAGLPEPFNPIQILWIAMIMDGPPAVSLALDAARPGIMHEPPRPRTVSLIPQRRLLTIAAYGTTMMVGTLAVLYYGMHSGTEAPAISLAFTTFVLFQFFNVFNTRVEYGSALNRQFFSNRMLWSSVSAVVVLQIIAVQWPPAQMIFSTTGLGAIDWLIAIAVASSVLVLEESRKFGALWASSRNGRLKTG